MYHQKDNLGNYPVFKCMKDLYRGKKKKSREEILPICRIKTGNGSVKEILWPLYKKELSK